MSKTQSYSKPKVGRFWRHGVEFSGIARFRSVSLKRNIWKLPQQIHSMLTGSSIGSTTLWHYDMTSSEELMANTQFLAIMTFSKHEHMLSPIRLSSVMLVHPTQPDDILAMFLRCLVPKPSTDVHGKFLQRSSQQNPSVGEFKCNMGSQI